MKISVVLACLLLGFAGLSIAAAGDAAKVLVGSWSGKATGPEGGPPTGDITLTFVRDDSEGVKGTIQVKGAGGAQYSGQISNVSLKDNLFAAKVTFPLGETPLEVMVSGPLKGKTIQGNFSVAVKEQKMGEGTFSVTRDPK